MLLLTCSVCLLRHPRTTNPGWGCTTYSDPPKLITNQGKDRGPWANLMVAFSQLMFLLPDNSTLCQVGKQDKTKNRQTKSRALLLQEPVNWQGAASADAMVPEQENDLRLGLAFSSGPHISSDQVSTCPQTMTCEDSWEEASPWAKSGCEPLCAALCH